MSGQSGFPPASTSAGASDRDPTLNRKVAAVWNANADFWDARMGEGNITHLQLVSPAIERLLELRPGDEVLEIACGNGQLARRMARLGAKVLAVDMSEGMLEHARTRSAGLEGKVEYRQLDASDPVALAGLGRGRFAAVVSAMALMDMSEIAPLAGALASLLAPGGRFVFAVTHPAFNGTGTRRMIEEEDVGGTMVQRAGVVVFRYGTPTTAKGLAMIDQPEPQYFFDRPLNELLRPFFSAGFAVDALEEPRFAPGTPTSRVLSWLSFPEIPPVLAVRMRPMRPPT
jgi:SAM-dependent methyltransferase